MKEPTATILLAFQTADANSGGASFVILYVFGAFVAVAVIFVLLKFIGTLINRLVKKLLD